MSTTQNIKLASVNSTSAGAGGLEGSVTRTVTSHVPGEVGIWAFIITDLAVFSLYFVTFLWERGQAQALFAMDSALLNMTIGVVSTIVLLTSSLFVALGVQAVRNGRGAAAQKHLIAAAAGGLVFIINKPIDWIAKVGAGHGPHHDNFFQLYFMMTGLHLLHVIVGMAVLAYLWRLAGQVQAAPTLRQLRFIENGASYWHLVDVIWLVLFALFYLIK